MEAFLTSKFRGQQDIFAKLITARDAKKKADTVQADAKRTYEELKRHFATMVAADSDDEVSDFVAKKAKHDDTSK